MAHVNTYVALIHHPVRDQKGAIVTTAITNLDVHDIARSSRTYGLGGYFVVHPVEQQRELVLRIVGHWERDPRHEFRRDALSYVSVVPTLEDATRAIEEREGRPPVLVATSARPLSGTVPFSQVRELTEPCLLLLGTGFGLDEAVTQKASLSLPPISGPTDYNHLSVRSACAILLDRLYGDRKD